MSLRLRIDEVHLPTLLLTSVPSAKLKIRGRMVRRREIEIRNATADMQPDIINRPEKGCGPKLVSPEDIPTDDELQFEKESICFSNSSIIPLSDTLRIASEISPTKGEPLRKTNPKPPSL